LLILTSGQTVLLVVNVISVDCQSYFMTNDQSDSMSGVEPILGFVTRYYFLSEGFSLKVAFLFLWGALSDERTGLQFAV
jgi:hypothetical protein